MLLSEHSIILSHDLTFMYVIVIFEISMPLYNEIPENGYHRCVLMLLMLCDICLFVLIFVNL